jgi:hypothetical protein
MRRETTIRRTPLAGWWLAGAASILGTTASTAQTAWTGANGNGNWNQAGNWTLGLPANNAASIVSLAGVNQRVTTQNAANPLTLNRLNFNANAMQFTVNPGSPLNFAGVAPEINVASGPSGFQYINTPISIAANR